MSTVFCGWSKNFFKEGEAGPGNRPVPIEEKLLLQVRKGADGHTGGLVQTLPEDSREEPAAACCRYCRGELYQGEEYYLVDGRAVCPDCLDILAREYFRLYRVEGGI